MAKFLKKKKPKKKREFTKQIVAAVLATYFFGVAIGAIVVLRTAPDQLYAFLTFIGAPTATTVGFYCWKAKNENLHKHQKGRPADDACDDASDLHEAPANDEEVFL